MENLSRSLINQNLARVPSGFFRVRTCLKHFALINYSVPVERLTKWIPNEIFEIETFNIRGSNQALLSIVPFVDEDFHFQKVFPWAKFKFPQTNHRVYVRHKKTGQRAVWFFGTTLGSKWVYIPHLLWKLPWHHGKYEVNCEYNKQSQCYQRYQMTISSDWCAASVDVEDSGDAVTMLDGFSDYDHLKLTLTHPIDGFYYRRDGKLGGYSIWHKEMDFTLAKPKNLYFSLYERLGILNPDEMQRPHSILLCPQSEFIIQVPPTLIK